MDSFSTVCFALVLFTLFLTGCQVRSDLAPVVESRWKSAQSRPRLHTVLRGETLYAIAFRYDQDYERLAVINRLRSPYTLRVGQRIALQPVQGSYRIHRAHPVPPQKPRFSASSHAVVVGFPRATANRRRSKWLWPVHGRVAMRFAPLAGQKGIDIAGSRGEKIRAAANGVVAYAGSGLPGYGNLIIIKHDNQFLTAYGDNLRNLVREGQRIQAGQVIADMGVVDRRYWGVHFEIRQGGNPKNPLQYLQNG